MSKIIWEGWDKRAEKSGLIDPNTLSLFDTLSAISTGTRTALCFGHDAVNDEFIRRGLT